MIEGRWHETIPNLLTGLRLVLVPVFVVVSLDRATAQIAAGWASPAFWIVVAVGVTDVLDGHLARRWNVTSRRGALLDAVADKSFQFVALVTVTAIGRPLFTGLPPWLVGAVVVRDLVLLGGWILLPRLGRPVAMEHESHGRIATVLVFGLIVGATLGWPETILAPMAGVAALVALLSAGAYVRRGFRPPESGPVGE